MGILLLYFAFKDIDLISLKKDFQTTRYGWILFSLIFAIIAYISRAIRWNLLIESIHFKPSLSNTFKAMMVGYLANFAFPRIGEVTRCASLAKKEKIPVDKLFGTVIVERVVDLFTLIILLLILIIFRFETFGNFFNENIFIPLSEKISSSLNFSKILWISTILVFSLILFLYILLRKKISRFKFVIKIKEIISGVIEGLKSVYKMKKRSAFIFHSLFIWLNYWAMTWVVVFAIPATSQLGMIDGLFLLVIGGLGMSVPVQGGIGAYHWIVSRGLLSVYGYISLEEGLVFATLGHESQALLAITLGAISFFLLFRKRKNKALNETPVSDSILSKPAS